MAIIHPKAHVDDSAKIGAGTRVWQFASVIRGAAIGEYCSIAACSIVDAARVGDGCTIGHGAQLHPGTRIGNDVFVGPGAMFLNDVWPRVGKDGFAARDLQNGRRHTIDVEDGAIIGAGAIIMPGVRIGRGAMVAAGAKCSEHVAAGTLYRCDGSVGRLPEDGGASRRMRWAS